MEISTNPVLDQAAPKGSVMLRLRVASEHSKAQLDQALETFCKLVSWCMLPTDH